MPKPPSDKEMEAIRSDSGDGVKGQQDDCATPHNSGKNRGNGPKGPY